MKVRPACWRASASASSFFLRSRSLGLMVGVAVSHQEAKIDRIAEQGAQVVDRGVGVFKMLPGGFHDVRQALAMLTSFRASACKSRIKRSLRL
jgi:hypothetical protein